MPSPEYQRQWRKNNPDKYREHYIKAWKKRGPYYGQKIRTKKELKQELPLVLKHHNHQTLHQLQENIRPYTNRQLGTSTSRLRQYLLQSPHITHHNGIWSYHD